MSKAVSSPVDVSSLKDEDFIGYCMVHVDRFKEVPSQKNEEHSLETIIPYVVESILSNKVVHGGYTFGISRNAVKLKGIEFNLVGNYFSQQNSITNCCAHAAIKMALRAYNFEQIHCEKINEELGIEHGNSQYYEENYSSFKKIKGLTSKQIQIAISKISGDAYKTLPLAANEMAGGNEFLQFIYSALESHLPVILLLTVPNGNKAKRHDGHAVALIGHTFSEHNWGSYGGSCYFSDDDPGYLSSSLWCDNFVIQDDNLGPFYTISSRFITDYIEFSRSREQFKINMMQKRPLSVDAEWSDFPLRAIVVYQQSRYYVKDILHVERSALNLLSGAVDQLKKKEKKDNLTILPDNDDFKLYFDDALDKGKSQTRYAENLISRTFLATKDEYYKSDFWKKNQTNVWGSNDVFCATINDAPDNLWIIELSIPELFWIGKKSIGEIVIDPKIYHSIRNDRKEKREDGVADEKLQPYTKSIRHIRLPNILLVPQEEQKEGGKENELKILPLRNYEQDRPYHDLIKIGEFNRKNGKDPL